MQVKYVKLKMLVGSDIHCDTPHLLDQFPLIRRPNTCDFLQISGGNYQMHTVIFGADIHN